MNEGIKILIERMKTNPEEFDFSERDNKWESLVYRYSDWLDEGDRTAFKEAISSMRQEKFTQEVMKELLDPKSEEVSPFIYQPHPMRTGGMTQGVSSVVNPYQQSQAQQQIYQAQIEYERIQKDLEEQRQEKLSMLQRILGIK